MIKVRILDRCEFCDGEPSRHVLFWEDSCCLLTSLKKNV